MECGNHEETSTNKGKGKKSRPKTKLGIPDLEHSKTAVLRSLGYRDSRRGYSMAVGYASYIKNHIRPQWGTTPMNASSQWPFKTG